MKIGEQVYEAIKGDAAAKSGLLLIGTEIDPDYLLGVIVEALETAASVLSTGPHTPVAAHRLRMETSLAVAKELIAEAFVLSQSCEDRWHEQLTGATKALVTTLRAIAAKPPPPPAPDFEDPILTRMLAPMSLEEVRSAKLEDLVLDPLPFGPCIRW